SGTVFWRPASPGRGRTSTTNTRAPKSSTGCSSATWIDFVDFDYMARVAMVNAAALWSLAPHRARPRTCRSTAAGPPTRTGPDGIRGVLRITTSSDWISAIDVGNVTSVTLDISKDDVQFGVRAFDQAGHRSPVGYPQVAA